jgi:TolB-like protein/DNA-binding winged helix-turn-helix (wHTH) protein
MGSNVRNLQVVHFADCTLDLQTAELCRNGIKVTLQDQPFQILVTLLENPGQLVTREELIRVLWPAGTFVDFDQSLNKAMARLRETLGDDAENPKFVETLPRKGYRWVGPPVIDGDMLVPESDPEQSERDKDGGSRGRNNWNLRAPYLLFIFVCLALVAWWASGWAGVSRGAARLPVIRSVAVLPLQNLLGDSSRDYVVDGLTDSLVTDLSRRTTDRVISRTSTMHYKGTGKTLPEIAKELKVDALIEGSVSESEGLLRINLQLIHAKTDAHLWAQVYEGDAKHILGLQAQFVRDIANQLQNRTQTDDAIGSVRSAGSRNDTSDSPPRLGETGLRANPTESQDLYLHGLYYASKTTKEGLQKGIDYFLKAVNIDEKNKLAYVGLAESYCTNADLGFAPPRQMYPLAKNAALKALALDDGLAEAHIALAWITYTYEWDNGRAEQEFRRAIQLNPNYSYGHALYGEYLARRGRNSESEQQVTTAIQLDPLSPVVLTEMYLPYYFSRRYESAIDASRRVLEMDPSFEQARFQLIFLYELTGNIDAAVRERFRADILKGLAPEAASEKSRRLQKEILLHGAGAYWQWRLKDALEQQQKTWSDPNDLAFINLHLGRKREALDWLEKAIRDRDAEFDMQNDPEFEDLWDEPRFQTLVAEMAPARM